LLSCTGNTRAATPTVILATPPTVILALDAEPFLFLSSAGLTRASIVPLRVVPDAQLGVVD